VTGGVIDLLAGEPTRRSLAQSIMEAEPVVRVYESRLWRRSPIATLALGISFEDEQAMISGAARLEGGETVLDLACGPGIYTRPFARQVPAGEVLGLDLSMPMLRYAARRAREEGLDNLTLIRGTALELPFPPHHFDLVNCCGALHLFADVRRVLGEIERVLKPGGRFTTAVFRREDGPLPDLAAAARRWLLGVASFTREELEGRILHAGLRDVWCHHESRAWLVMSARKA
jgi:ubiquinone/menaquinone biosynthesis C-methylase UbiE